MALLKKPIGDFAKFNKETIEAIENIENNENLTEHKTIDDLFDDLNADD